MTRNSVGPRLRRVVGAAWIAASIALAPAAAFKPIEFLMPIFASPIVFIPLLTISSDAAMNGPFTQARLMVYLVAFQNGFFWKNFFDEKKPRVLAAPAEAR